MLWRRWLSLAGVTAIASTVVGCGGGQGSEQTSSAPAGEVSTEQVREIAKQAYIYGYPMVDNYRIHRMPQSLLVANPINRYLINSPMLPTLNQDPDGGYTIYLQKDSPGADKESNWLPAPEGPFAVIMRLYWPEPPALDGTWKAPVPEQVR